MSLLSRLGYLLMPRRFPRAPSAASVSVFPCGAREAPLVVSTCCVFDVLVFSCVLSSRFVFNVDS
jgi:hypothetical protein